MNLSNIVKADKSQRMPSVLVKLISALCFIWASLSMNANAEEAKIYQQDAIGNTQYNKPSYAVQQDGRIIETDTLGNKLYHKQQYQKKDGKIYQTDSLGNIQYHKPQFVIK